MKDRNVNRQMAIIYCRVASAEEHYYDHRLGAQERCCREYAEQNGYGVADVFSDNASGNTADRPGIQAMLAFLQEHRAERPVVIIDDISRLARQLSVHVELREKISASGGRLESPAFRFGDDPGSQLTESILASYVEWQDRTNTLRRDTDHEGE